MIIINQNWNSSNLVKLSCFVIHNDLLTSPVLQPIAHSYTSTRHTPLMLSCILWSLSITTALPALSSTITFLCSSFVHESMNHSLRGPDQFGYRALNSLIPTSWLMFRALIQSGYVHSPYVIKYSNYRHRMWDLMNFISSYSWSLSMST